MRGTLPAPLHPAPPAASSLQAGTSSEQVKEQDSLSGVTRQLTPCKDWEWVGKAPPIPGRPEPS